MKKEKDIIQADPETVESSEPQKTKFRHFWDYVTDYKRKTVALALPSIAFDIVYSIPIYDGCSDIFILAFRNVLLSCPSLHAQNQYFI